MSRELSDHEYVRMLVRGNASIFWHCLPRKPKDGDLEDHIQQAIYRGVRQALNDRGGFGLPTDLKELLRLAQEDEKRLDASCAPGTGPKP